MTEKEAIEQMENLRAELEKEKALRRSWKGIAEMLADVLAQALAKTAYAIAEKEPDRDG